MVTTHAADRDRVHNLPGIGKPSSPLYAGYITVDESAGRALFYILAESASSVDDPVILWYGDRPFPGDAIQLFADARPWSCLPTLLTDVGPAARRLNGGPGCSSIGGGFLSELGPYYPSKDGSSLKANQYAWNREAHVVFLESPAFVGFSYSNTSTDAVVGDARTASDSFTFLRAFFRRFPHLADNPFFIAGESYAGHYVPNLAALIVTHNQANEEASSGSKGSLSKASSINLQGLLVGNPWTDAAIDNEGAVDFWWAHGEGARSAA